MIRRVLSGLAAAGFVASAIAQVVSFLLPGSTMGPWLLPLLGAALPLGLAGAFVSLRLSTAQGVWNGRAQARYILERCPRGTAIFYYTLCALTAVRFVPYVRSSTSHGIGQLADLPLGPTSAVCMTLYFTLWCLFVGGLSADHPDGPVRSR